MTKQQVAALKKGSPVVWRSLDGSVIERGKLVSKTPEQFTVLWNDGEELDYPYSAASRVFPSQKGQL